MPPRFAPICLCLLLIYPRESLAAARDAFALWQMTVAPSLIPFFALIPALTTAEATSCFARLLRLPCRLLGIPADFAGAAGVALSAGSPAGARALMHVAARRPYPAGDLFRAAMLCSGVSPGFLISGAGAGMLGDPAAGICLMLSQLLALAAASVLLRCIPLPAQSVSLPPAAEESAPSPGMFAARGVLSILVWMTVFSAGTAVLSALLPAAAPIFAFAAEFSAGCAHAASLRLPLWAVAAVAGFGGICAGCQNLAVLKPLSLPPGMYFAVKVIHAALCALFCRALTDIPLPALSLAPRHVLPLLIFACLLPIFHKIVTPAPK